MTGLDLSKHHIIEMACIITDHDLNILAEGEDIVIHQPDDVLDNMNEWCIEHHGKSGQFVFTSFLITSYYFFCFQDVKIDI